jgi:hypothetical protein
MKKYFTDKEIAERYCGKYEPHNPITAAKNHDCEWCYFSTIKEYGRYWDTECKKDRIFTLKGKNKTIKLTAEDFCQNRG